MRADAISGLAVRVIAAGIGVITTEESTADAPAGAMIDGYFSIPNIFASWHLLRLNV
jgi:hypothetical protein